jgi:hypothetical protein
LNIARKREKSRKGVYEKEWEFVGTLACARLIEIPLGKGNAAPLRVPRFARGTGNFFPKGKLR